MNTNGNTVNIIATINSAEFSAMAFYTTGANATISASVNFENTCGSGSTSVKASASSFARVVSSTSAIVSINVTIGVSASVDANVTKTCNFIE